MAAASLFELTCLAVITAAGAALLGWLAFVRPRLGMYALFALAPTQFIFLPVGNFFVSPADVIATACGAGIAFRAAAGRPETREAIRMHAMLGFMLAAYLVGFVWLDHFSRTLIRLPLAIIPSILACELVTRRRHLGAAITALVVAALLDAAYGAAFVMAGQPLHPTRFSGMMGVNFSANLMAAGAVMAFARVAASRDPVNLVVPLVLAALTAATLSRTALVALLLGGSLVLWTVASARNRRLVLGGAAVALGLLLATSGGRDRVIARNEAAVEQDGIFRTSGDVRTKIVGLASHAFATAPVVGIGYANFQPYSTRDPEIGRSTKGEGYATHDTYLEIAIEGGLLALVPFLWHFATYVPRVRRAWAVVRQDRDGLVAAAIGALLVAGITAMAANVLLHYAFWVVAGTALACGDRIDVLRRPGAAS